MSKAAKAVICSSDAAPIALVWIKLRDDRGGFSHRILAPPVPQLSEILDHTPLKILDTAIPLTLHKIVQSVNPASQDLDAPFIDQGAATGVNGGSETLAPSRRPLDEKCCDDGFEQGLKMQSGPTWTTTGPIDTGLERFSVYSLREKMIPSSPDDEKEIGMAP